MPNLSSLGCLAAELESVTPDAAGRTPGENRSNPGFASLVLGPELSNYSWLKFDSFTSVQILQKSVYRPYISRYAKQC